MEQNQNRRSLKLNIGNLAPPKIEPSFLHAEPGRLHFSDSEQYDFTAQDLVEGECIGVGAYGGVVTRMVHAHSERIMAVKRIRAHEVDSRKRGQMLRELRIIIGSQCCEDIVRFYGALFHDGDCWICMELMDCSLDKFYPLVYRRGNQLPERVIGFITAAVVRALNYLKKELKIIHRDVKPSNILLDQKGLVKLCDFGISGDLVDSIAKTQDVGCRFYMAPERLMGEKSYDVRSDVWSLGITLVEVCLGRFPFDGWKTVFDQLRAVVNGDPPYLSTNEHHSYDLVEFVNQCLIKEMEERPKFSRLMEHPFFKHYNHTDQIALANERTFFSAYMGNYLTRN